MTKTAVIDCEIYRNYFLLAAMNVDTRKLIYIEMHEGQPFDKIAAARLMRDYLTISFNGLGFDNLLIQAAIAGANLEQLKGLCDEIIVEKKQAWQVRKAHDIYAQPHDWNCIDVMQVVAGKANLKIYGGRMGMPTLQDLPLDPSALLTSEDRAGMRKYCVNDLDTTLELYNRLAPQIKLREAMSTQYGIDMRSKGDAQIAEAIMKHEVEAALKKKVYAPKPEHVKFNYKPAGIINFAAQNLKDLYSKILDTQFQTSKKHAIELPDWLKKDRIEIDGRYYKIGIGGIHSQEKKQAVVCAHDERLFELDVASYYPNIILEQNIKPTTLKNSFQPIYKRILKERLTAKHTAKHTGDTATNETLKIVLNGSFGKLGAKHSILRDPQAFIQVTLTGQLSLLMLIERITATGASVVSANTDGIVVLTKKDNDNAVMKAAFDWELETSYPLERTDYSALYSRDVNNYLAIKNDCSTKGKGIFAATGLSKNPDCPIIYTAVKNYILNKTPLKKTILNEKSILEFMVLRQVSGGAVWRGEKLGKAVRFYYSNEVAESETINYISNGNTVGKSAGGRPCMVLPDVLPTDINYEHYIKLAEKVLKGVGL